VPGTYDISDIGRFVQEFDVYDSDHKVIESEKVSSDNNQWLISRPEDAYLIEYTIAETFDTPVTEHQIYRMAGTSIESDHVLLNTFAVLGYPQGLSKRDFYLRLKYPSGWIVGTSMEKKLDDKTFYARDYDRLSDSPFLLGSLSTSSTMVDATTIGVYTYSENKVVNSNQLLSDISPILTDASEFLNGLPVDRYNFLFYYWNHPGAGALEHSYSSVYVLREAPVVNVRNITAHEFFHIVTPLNIHSEIISNFNFETPTPSEHLWLYEGVTEWAAHMMQYRNGSISMTSILDRLAFKISRDKFYDPTYSLSQIALTCYTDLGQAQFGNIYQRGAVVATLLDIRLLELSGGTYGLRELILELIDTYGPEQAFSEATFFVDLVALTYPEIEDFIDSYIKDASALPLQEYFAKIGIEYDGVDGSLVPMASPTQPQLDLREKWSMNF
jgi:predicted metalloprotease with PDZ domain